MTKAIVINGNSVSPVDLEGRRVVTFAMIDDLHQRPEGTAKRNYSANKKHLTVGEDYIEVTADEIRTQSLTDVFAPRTAKGILLTESGYLMLVKSFTDDLAWKVQRELVNVYFRAKDETKPKRIRKTPFDVAFARCLRVASHFTHLDENQRLLSAARGTKELSGINPLELMGITSIAAPTQDNYLTPTEIGKQIGLSAIATNKLIIAIGYQVKSVGSSASSDYVATEAGEKYGRMFDTTRKHGKGSQQQLKWSPDLAGILRKAVIAGEAKAA